MMRMPHQGIRTRGNLKNDMEQKMNSSNTPKQPLQRYDVENDVPVPSPRKQSRKSKYPFGVMLPNQSVMIPNKSYAAVIGVLRKHKSEGKKFIVRATEGGQRVWRLE